MSNELIEFVLVSIALLGIGIYGLAVKRNAIRMLFAVEIIVNAANLNLVAFARFMPCLLYTSPSPRDKRQSRMPSSA